MAKDGTKLAIGIGVAAGVGALIYFATRGEAAPPKEYRCPYCGEYFATYEELADHVRIEHPGERIPLPIIWE